MDLVRFANKLNEAFKPYNSISYEDYKKMIENFKLTKDNIDDLDYLIDYVIFMSIPKHIFARNEYKKDVVIKYKTDKEYSETYSEKNIYSVFDKNPDKVWIEIHAERTTLAFNPITKRISIEKGY